MTHPKWKTSDEFLGSISIPFGIKLSHTWHEVGKILRIINDYEIQTVLELGIHVGGLASIISCRGRFYDGFKYVGFDNDSRFTDDHILHQCQIIYTDVLKNSQEVINYSNGRTLVYCDGGNKIREMEIYSKLIKSGDVIICHDYFDGQEVVGLPGFGNPDKCPCLAEVWKDSLSFLFEDENFSVLSEYLLEGTRLMGFIKI